MYVYVPNSFVNYKCVVPNANYIRLYETKPVLNSTVNYVDLYTSNHYYFVRGTQTFGNYSYSITCSNDYKLTDDYWYRTDLDSILICVFVIAIICIYFPARIFSRVFGRWLKW